MNYSNRIWWFRIGANPETTLIMPSGARITECDIKWTLDYQDRSTPNGCLITYPDGSKRWISNNWFNDINTDIL
jgi:hypothetical protein